MSHGPTEERVAIALEGADYDAENPAVTVASAVVLYLAAHPGEVDSDEDPDHVIRRAVRLSGAATRHATSTPGWPAAERVWARHKRSRGRAMTSASPSLAALARSYESD